MIKISDFIESLELSIDQSYRGHCPICNGKNTFTVIREHGSVLYNCYKNSCGISGKHQKDMDVATIRRLIANDRNPEMDSESVLAPYVLPPYLIPYMKADNPPDPGFLYRYLINPDHIMYDIRQERIVFTIKSSEGVIVDAVGRSLTGRNPKWLRYAASPMPYTYGGGKTAVVVEDAISAYTVGNTFSQCTGLALLGTQLTDFHRTFIRDNYDRSIVALDPDALHKSYKIAREIDARVLNLKDDLKYRLPDDLHNLKEMLHDK